MWICMGRGAIVSICLLPLCGLILQGCGNQQGACRKGDKACEEMQVLIRETKANCPMWHPHSKFVGTPRLPSVSESCATVEFLYAGDLPVAYIYGRQSKDSEYTAEWGGGLRPLDITDAGPDDGQIETATATSSSDRKIRRYRALMRKLPAHKAFEVKLADKEDAAFEGSSFSCPSKPRLSSAEALVPAAPYDLQLHRTDPRINVKNDEGSVCMDLHWSHPHTELALLPDDAYFRIFTTYEEEAPKLFCEDKVGVWKRECGIRMRTASSKTLSFATKCGLWPKRRVTFTIEA